MPKVIKHSVVLRYDSDPLEGTADSVSQDLKCVSSASLAVLVSTLFAGTTSVRTMDGARSFMCGPGMDLGLSAMKMVYPLTCVLLLSSSLMRVG